jgi:hypothetical protein
MALIFGFSIPELPRNGYSRRIYERNFFDKILLLLIKGIWLWTLYTLASNNNCHLPAKLGDVTSFVAQIQLASKQKIPHYAFSTTLSSWVIQRWTFPTPPVIVSGIYFEVFTLFYYNFSPPHKAFHLSILFKHIHNILFFGYLLFSFKFHGTKYLN